MPGSPGADALLISLAEHNGHYPAAYKNLFDWTSRLGKPVYQGKPVVFLAASPGPGGASSVLAAAEMSAPYFGAELKGKMSVAGFNDMFDIETGALSDAELSQMLGALLADLGAAVALTRAA